MAQKDATTHSVSSMTMEWLYPKLMAFAPSLLSVLLLSGAILLYRRYSHSKHPPHQGTRISSQFTMLLLVLAGVSAVVITLPIDAEIKSQLFSLMGIVLSAAIALSSTTIIGNVLAGLMLNSNENLKLGEFIQVNEFQGRITERGLLQMEIQSEDKNLTVLPNLYLVTHPYRVIHSKGTIISVDLSLGYDVNRKRIESELISAAEKAGLESPFVQILELGDFSVSYRVAGVLKEIKQRMSAKTELFKAVLDTLHDANIEIMSPNFMNTRALDRKDTAIPSKERHLSDEETLLPIESIVFDKAEQAETLGTLQEKLETAREGIAKLKALRKEASSEQAASLKGRIQNLGKIQEKIEQRIEQLERKKGD